MLPVTERSTLKRTKFCEVSQEPQLFPLGHMESHGVLYAELLMEPLEVKNSLGFGAGEGHTVVQGSHCSAW